MPDTYAPFPESELTALAQYHTQVARTMNSNWTKGLHEDRAKACLDAIACHTALRERCLVAELALNHGVREESSHAA